MSQMCDITGGGQARKCKKLSIMLYMFIGNYSDIRKFSLLMIMIHRLILYMQDKVFNTGYGPYGEPPLKINILKSGYLNAKGDQKITPEPTFHESRS